MCNTCVKPPAPLTDYLSPPSCTLAPARSAVPRLVADEADDGVSVPKSHVVTQVEVHFPPHLLSGEDKAMEVRVRGPRGMCGSEALKRGVIAQPCTPFVPTLQPPTRRRCACTLAAPR